MLTGEEQLRCTTTKSLSDFIAAKGLNMSRQRILVMDAFLSEMQLISADDLFIKLRTKHSTLGRSTVYRTLKLIAECGIARVILADRTCRYEKSHAAKNESPLRILHTGAEPVS